MHTNPLATSQHWERCMKDTFLLVRFRATPHTTICTHPVCYILVRRSLAENDLTVVSIFVNPAQFAPHEDLATYPRTLSRDLELLAAEKVHSKSASSELRIPSAVFLPTVSEMYPSGIVQNVAEQKGTFIEVKGYGHQMEGKSRPTFFRGVATVVTKLFNAIQVSSSPIYSLLKIKSPFSLPTHTLAKKISNKHCS